MRRSSALAAIYQKISDIAGACGTLQFVRRATIAFLCCAALAIASGVVWYATKDWLVALGVRIGVEQYNARMNSTLTIQEASLDLFRLTATVRGITIAARGQTALDSPIDIGQVQAKVRLWPLLQRRIVIEDAAASKASIRLDIDRHHHVNLEELFQLLVDDGSDMPSTWNASVHRFTVDQLTLHLSVEGQPLATTLQSMVFQGSMTLVPLRIRTEMLGGRGEVSYDLGSERLHYHLLQMTARVDLVRDRLVVEQLQLEAPEFAITGRGHLAQGQVEAQFNGDVGLAKLSPLMPEVPPLGGSLAVRGRLSGSLEAPQLAVTAESLHLAVGPDTVSDLRVHAQMMGRHVHIERFALGLAAGTVRGSGRLDLAAPRVDMHVELAALSLTALLSLVGQPFPALDGHLGGQVHVALSSFVLDDLQVTGSVAFAPRAPSSPPVTASSLFPLPLSVQVDFHLADRRLMLKRATWAIDRLQGELSGMQALDGTAHLHGTLNADLAAPIFAALGLQDLQGEAQITFGVQGRLLAPRVTAELQLQQARYHSFSLEHLRLAIEAEGAEVKILSLVGRQRQARYQLQGAVTLAAPFSQLHQTAVTFPIRAISELELNIEHADLAMFSPFLPDPVPLAGDLSLRASGGGSWPSLHGYGRGVIRGLVVDDQALGDISLVVEGSPTEVVLTQLVVHLGGGEVHASGTARLPHGLLEGALTWQGVYMERLPFLQEYALPILGALNGSVRARGTWPNVQAEVTVQGPRLTAYGLEVADLQLQAMASPREVQLDRLVARVAGARLTATGHTALDGPFDVQVSSEPISLRGMTIVPEHMTLEGGVRLDLQGSGTFAAPQLSGQLQLTGIRASGVTIGTGALAFTLNDRRMTFSSMGLRGFDLHGAVTLEEMLPAQVHLGIYSLDLGPIVARFVGNGQEELAGDVSGTVEINGPLRSPPQWAGQMTIEHLRLHSKGIAFSNPAPLRWRLEQGVLQFEAVQLQAEEAHLDIRGTVDLWQDRLDIAVLGHSPLAIVGTRIPGLRFQQGLVDTHVSVHGRLSRPVLNGQVLLKDGAIYIAAIHENLRQLRGEIQFADQTIAIQSLQGQLAGGGLEVSGEVRLRGLQLQEMSLATQLNQARLRYPAGFFTMLDADLVISGNSAQQLIAGEVSLSRARYRQDFDLASLLRPFRHRGLEPPPMAQERLHLDIRVSLHDPLRVENRLAKLELLPDLHVRGSVNRPIVLGRVEIEQGTADVAGTRFWPISGNIDFLNPTRTEPFFDIAADTQKNGYQIHVIATGTPQHIDLQLTSEPPLAETDILALLTVGATGQALTTGLSTVLPGRLSAFLTGRLAEEIGRGVGGLVGVDRLDIEPVIGGAQRVGGPKVTVGKDVSKNLSVAYSTIVGSTQEDTVSMEYRLTDNISILGVRDERGDVGVDVKYSIRFE